MSTPLSVQLYSLRDSMAKDFDGTLRRVAEIGYAGVETAGFPGTTARAARQLCDDLGLKVSSCHGPAPVGATRQEALDLAADLGLSRLVLPFYDPAQFQSVDGVYGVADHLNAAAAEAKAAGLRFGYHNHWFEFAPINGKPAFEYLLERLSPDVEFELDLYWAKVGGQDPNALIKRLGDRVPLLHVKDGPATGYEAAMGAATLSGKDLQSYREQLQSLVDRLRGGVAISEAGAETLWLSGPGGIISRSRSTRFAGAGSLRIFPGT